MLQTHVFLITYGSLQKRTGAFSLEHFLANRTLLWAGHVARMHNNRLPKCLMLSWIPGLRVAGGQEMTYGWSLQGHLAHLSTRRSSPTGLLAQDRAGRRKLMTEPPYMVFLRGHPSVASWLSHEPSISSGMAGRS